MDLVLNLPNDGIRLVFDPVTQRLKVLIYSNFLLLSRPHVFNTSLCLNHLEPSDYHEFSSS